MAARGRFFRSDGCPHQGESCLIDMIALRDQPKPKLTSHGAQLSMDMEDPILYGWGLSRLAFDGNPTIYLCEWHHYELLWEELTHEG